MAKLAWAYGGTYGFMTGSYRDHYIPYISMIGVINSGSVEPVKRQRLSFCDDQDCRFSSVTIVVPMLAVWLGQGNKALGYQFSMWG